MGFRDIIEGTGRGYWFGYGKFMGVHWGRPSTQDVIKVAADPFYSGEEFGQLITEPDSRYRSRWQGWSKGRVLTDEERDGVIKTLFEKAREYEGVAKRRMFQRLMSHRNFAGTQRVEDFCVSAVNANELDAELLMENMGSQILARVNPSVSTPYLESRFYDKKQDRLGRKLFMERVLDGLGMGISKHRPVYTSENIVSWIPLVIYAIGEGAIDPEYCADRIEEFFAGFPYESALLHLLQALQSEISVKGKVISRQLKASGLKGREDFCNESWKGYDEGYTDFLYDEYEITFGSRRSIADGARTSLTKFGEAQPKLNPQIADATKRYDEKPRKTFTETECVKTQEVGGAITNSYRAK